VAFTISAGLLLARDRIERIELDGWRSSVAGISDTCGSVPGGDELGKARIIEILGCRCDDCFGGEKPVAVYVEQAVSSSEGARPCMAHWAVANKQRTDSYRICYRTR